MSISDLDRKITYSRKDDFDKLQSISLYAHDETEGSSQNLKALKITPTGELKVDISSGSGSHGLATEAKQDDQITKLGEIDTVLDSVNGKISKGNDVISAGGELQQVLMYGKKPDNTLQPLETSGDRLLVDVVELAIAGKISTSTALSATQVCGFDDGTSQFKTMKVSSDGSLITNPAGAPIITTDGDTSEQRVMILANHNGNLRTVKCGEGGTLATESDHSWDNTNTIIDIVSTPAGATITSETFDLGQGIGHELGAVEFFLTNSDSLDIEVTPEVSVNGSVWYSLANPSPVITTAQYVSFGQEEIGISVGNRYMRFQVTNNDATDPTDITLIVGYYK